MNGDQQLFCNNIILRSYRCAINKHVQYHHGAVEKPHQGLISADSAYALKCTLTNKDKPDIGGSQDSAAGTSSKDAQEPTGRGQQADENVQSTLSQEQYIPQYGRSCSAGKGPLAAGAVPTTGHRPDACPSYNELQDSGRPSEAGTGAQPMQPPWSWWLPYPPPPPPPPLPPFLCPPFSLLPAKDAQWHYGMW